MTEQQQQTVKLMAQLSEAIQELGLALGTEDPLVFHRSMSNAHALTSVATTEMDTLVELAVRLHEPKISSGEFCRRLLNRDRDAGYKAFKKSPRRLRGLSDE